MVKDIEKEFFKAFKPFGILHNCIIWMEREYDLGFYSTTKTKPKAKWSKETLDLHNKEHQKIKDQVEKFKHGIVLGYDIEDTPLMVEISNNFDECKDDKAKEQYIYDLLTPFNLYSDIMHPIDVIERYQAGIEEYKKGLQIWEQEPEKPENKAQIEAGKNLIKGLQNQIERANYVAKRYREILNKVWNKTETVENCLAYLIFLIGRYAVYLDVLLLKRGINLLYYQQECGIYLFEYRHTTDVEAILGNRKLAQKYIKEALPKHTGEPKQQDNKIVLPDELNTPEARYMLKELIKAGYCDEKYNWNSDKWKPKRDVMALACFAVEATKYLNLKKICYNGKETTQWKVFEKLFNYRGKKEGTNKLKSKKDEYSRGYPQFNPPEMDEIKDFFKRLENTKD